MTLLEQMDDLVRAAREHYPFVANEADPHYRLCHKLAEEYHLYDTDNCFPSWLSRIVEGAIKDVQEEDPERFPMD